MLDDPFWQATLNAVETADQDGSTIVGPSAFAGAVRDYYIYEYKELADRVDTLIVHKGFVEKIGKDYIRSFLSDASVVFANEVFVVLQRGAGPTGLWTEHSQSFLDSLSSVIEMDEPISRTLYQQLRDGEYEKVEQQIPKAFIPISSTEADIDFSFCSKGWLRLFVQTYTTEDDCSFDNHLLHRYAGIMLGISDWLGERFAIRVAGYKPMYDGTTLRLLELASLDRVIFQAVSESAQMKEFISRHCLSQTWYFPENKQSSPNWAADLQPIDVVYTWFDVNDDDWDKARRRLSGKKDNELTGRARFANIGEIYVSIMSVLRYAPFIRTIYIVSDGQSKGFDSSKIEATFRDKIVHVSHDDILTSDVRRPTFNSDVIEAFLHRIPGLSDTFLYFNDDCFLGAPLKLTDLFAENGLPRLLANHRIWKKEDLRVHGALPADRDAHTIRCFQSHFGPLPSFIPAHQMMICSKASFERTLTEFSHEFKYSLFYHQVRDYGSVRFLLLNAWLAAVEGRQKLSIIDPRSEIYRVGLDKESLVQATSGLVTFLCLNNLNDESAPLFDAFSQRLLTLSFSSEPSLAEWLL